MKIEKEQKNQLILLCCLITLVVGFGVYRMLGATTNAASPTQSEVQSAHKTVQDASGGSDTGNEPLAAAETSVSVQPMRDPFQPQVLPMAEDSKPVTTSSVRRLPLIAQESRMTFPIMPPMGGEGVGMRPLPMPVVDDPTREMRLTGVVEGEVNLAIIRGAGDTRHIVREGQSIDGKYVVKSISRTGVRLARNGRSYFLVLSSGKAEG